VAVLEGVLHHLAVGLQVLVDLSVEGVLHPLEDEEGGEQQHHRHRARHCEHQPGDDPAAADQPPPQVHALTRSRR
jgi:hypothetical protein